MEKKILLDDRQITMIIKRLCRQLLENHDDFSNSAIIGLQPRGIHLAQRICTELQSIVNQPVPLGMLDVTFNRDDFKRRDVMAAAYPTEIPFIIENKKVVLVDDVLYTGRTVRAALDALLAYGRPHHVELLVLIDRRYSRELPIEPNYTGRQVNSLHSQRVLAQWKEQEDANQDAIWLMTQP